MAHQQEPRTREIEWQFDAPDLKTVEHWIEYHSAGLPYVISEDGAAEQRDTYYDTEDWRLHRAGYALRLREKGERTEATLKALTPARDGVRDREEHTEDLDAQTLEPLAKAPGRLGELARALAGAKTIQPLLTVETTRRTFPLMRGEKRVGELLLDEVRVPDDADAEPHRFSRIEVEIDGGRDEALDAFVDALRTGARLQTAERSKFETALEIRGITPATDPDLGPAVVAAEHTVGETAFAVLRRQHAAFASQEIGVRLGEDAEAVHDMRVAARRMRAAMSLFRDALPEDAQRLREELSWIAGALGAVRDLDIQIEQLETWRETLPDEDARSLDELRGLLRARRGVARRALLRALNAARYDALLTRMTEMLQAGPQPGPVLAGEPVLAVAPNLIDRRYRRVRALGDAITPESPPADYHALRIQGKRLRYALEFHAPIYARSSPRMIEALVAMQDVLGRHQDYQVAVDQLRDLMGGSGRKPSLEAAFVLGGIARRYEELAAEERARFPDVYRRIGGRRWARVERELERRRPAASAPEIEPEPVAHAVDAEETGAVVQ